MKKRIIKIIVGVFLFFLLAGIGGISYALWSIHKAVKKDCEMAQIAHPHPGDDVLALMDFLESDSHSLEERNKVIWALGRKRDSRALPVLEFYYTGELCDHSKSLCQYELEKAIKNCGAIPSPPRKIKNG